MENAKFIDKLDLAKVFYEDKTSEIGPYILTSTIKSATKEEIEKEIENNKNGRCQHKIVIDQYGWMYDFRSCAICRKGLGSV